jgi:ribonuclease E
MAGLIVIDFIDMEQNSHVRKVEKAMKEALKNDRARIQVGRISTFGLMEMSRQRLRTGVLEASTKACPHCEGTGLMRTASSAGLSALRIVEDEAARGRGEKILLRAGREAAVYLLNKKRAELAEIEVRYGVSVEVAIDETFEGARMTVESSGPRPVVQQRAPEPTLVEDDVDEDVIEDEDEDEDIEDDADRGEARGPQDDRPGRRRRRRRRGGRGRRREGVEGGEAPASADGDALADEAAEEQIDEDVGPPEQEAPAPSGDRKRRRRRGKRSEPSAEEASSEVISESSPIAERPTSEELPIAAVDAPAEAAPEPSEHEKPKRKRSRTKAKKPEAEETTTPESAAGEEPLSETSEKDAPAKPARRSRSKKAPVAEPVSAEASVPSADNDQSDALGEGGEPRRGWWQRTFG